MEKETCRLKETNVSKNKKIIDKNLINICPKVKSTRYIAEMTTQKKEKCLSGWGRGGGGSVGRGRGKSTCLIACVLASCQLRNFLCEFTEKCFPIFDQSSCVIRFTWYQLLLFFREFSSVIPFMVLLQDSSQMKGTGYIFMSSNIC